MVDSDDESGPQDGQGANENDAEETKAEESEEEIPFGPDNPGPFFPEEITPRNFVSCIQQAIPMTAKRRNEDGSITHDIAQNVAEEIAAEVEAQRCQMAEASTYTFLGLDPNNPEHRIQVESLRALGSAVPASAPAPAATAAPAASAAVPLAESTSEDDEGSVSRRVKRAKRGKKKGSS